MEDDDGSDGTHVAHVAEAKAALRRRVRVQRARRTPAERSAAAAGLRDVALTHLDGVSAVAAYAAVPGEPDLALLRDALRARGVVVLLPSTATGSLTWGLDDDHVRPGRALPSGLVLDEPTSPAPLGVDEVDLLLLPATAVDPSGARLGQGGGYYDRALAGLGGWDVGADGGRALRRPLLVAVVHDDELLEPGAVPVAVHDLRVHAVLTPTRWVVTT